MPTMIRKDDKNKEIAVNILGAPINDDTKKPKKKRRKKKNAVLGPSFERN